MQPTLSLLLSAFLLLTVGLCAPSEPISKPSVTQLARRRLQKRGEPHDYLPDNDPNTHPNQENQVDAAFNDAFELADYVLTDPLYGIDSNSDIFTKYFDEGDRAAVKNFFHAVVTDTDSPEIPWEGSDKLDNLLVQTFDSLGYCDDDRTLAYSDSDSDDNPFIVLCERAFRKKAAVSALDGVDDPFDPKYYITCEELGNTLSYRMNSLGMTLLHEYMHYDYLVEHV